MVRTLIASLKWQRDPRLRFGLYTTPSIRHYFDM